MVCGKATLQPVVVGTLKVAHPGGSVCIWAGNSDRSLPPVPGCAAGLTAPLHHTSIHLRAVCFADQPLCGCQNRTDACGIEIASVWPEWENDGVFSSRRKITKVQRSNKFEMNDEASFWPGFTEDVLLLESKQNWETSTHKACTSS